MTSAGTETVIHTPPAESWRRPAVEEFAARLPPRLIFHLPNQRKVMRIAMRAHGDGETVAYATEICRYTPVS